MLHKGKLQAALQVKRGQFSLYDGSYSEQLKEYQQALEILYKRFQSSDQLEQILPPVGVGQSAGARPSIEFDRWLVAAEQSAYHGPLFPFGSEFANHEQARQWAECIEGITTVAVDGSQLLPWRDASIPVALVQVGFFINPHAAGQIYTKDVRMEVMAPDDIAEPSKGDTSSDSDNYPYSDMQVTLRRYLLEIDTLCEQMEQLARARRAGDPVYSPVVFFDGSLVVSFALMMQDTYRNQYINSVITLLQTSEELRVPLIGYIDTSYARDMITMLRRIDGLNAQPVLRDAHKIHDALLWQGRMRWGDRTPAMICARGDILESYGPYRDKVAFSYLQTSSRRPPARLEFPRWMLEAGIVEPVMDVVRAELIAGNGYPYAIETADAVSVITMQDRNEFYAHFQSFIEREGAKFTFSTKSLSKGRRR